MRTVTQDDLWFCDDCYIIAETGDASSFDYYLSPSKAADRVKEIERELSLYEKDGHLVSDNDSETGEGIEEFSRRVCDCCGTGLAGGRHRMVLLGNNKQ
jgi:hypothetical protein